MNRRRWHDADDQAPAPDPMPLFEQPAMWPERSPATDEQIVGAIGGTIQADYEAWRKTEDGERALNAFLKDVLEDVARGATRLSGKATWERIRRQLQIKLNNDFHALMVRDVERLAPITAGLFVKRQRKAS